MELTIEQALQQGVAAHKEGKLQDAERLYRAILQSQPLHPDANHNLGVLAVSVNKADSALPLFKTALESNPKIEQYWLSYIDALIKENQLEVAKAVLEQGRKVGLAGDKVDALKGQLSVSVVSIESSSDELAPAIKFREAGKFQEAQEWLQKLIESQPNHAEAFSLLCHVLLLDKKDVEAERALLTAASINSELASIYRNQARLLLKQSNPEGALKKAKIGYNCSENNPESWLVLAACLNANQRSQEALDLTEKVLISNPNHAEAHATRALIRLHSNDIIGAIADAGMAVTLKPHLTQIWRLLGSLHYENKNLSGAIEASEKVHELEPTDVNCMVSLGEFLRQGKRVFEAITILEKAAEIAPEDINVWINLGTAFQQDEQIDKAKKAYEKASVINPKSAEISNNLGSIAKNTGDWMSALQHFENALEISPNIAEAHSNLGISLQELGRFDEAEASLRQAITLKPDSAEAHYNLGNTLKELGRLEEAEAGYKLVIALKPDFAEPHNNLGVILKERGRLDEAEESFRQALILKPDFAEAYDHLGNLLQILGKFEDAEMCYKKYISLAPFEISVTKSMASMFFDQGEFQKALSLFDSYNTPISRSLALECLYAIGNTKEIYKRIEDTVELDGGNLRVAAFASFIGESQQKDTAHRFCRKPLEFLHFSNLSSKMENSNSFIKNLIEDLKNIQTVWQPPKQSGRGGFQTVGNLFRYPNSNIVTLKEIILNEIDAYFEKFKNESCSFIEKWPAEKNIMGWHMMLKEQGYHNLHIHQAGWLSGVIYLKVVPSLNKNEGAIIFNVAGSNRSDPNSPKIIHNPEVGDMILFPSSLYHGTIPFSTDRDRIVVSFDLKPSQTMC
ncbi:tetratricopeptide repeat protein [Candidatus Njordibacter sp. Uisw_058]|uniref:tetratricopeptide repeat protein n=1 Tax=Candidatus Njordibacter sp. Uisw_058 TaxID=3230974 RepID=UPI003D5B15BC